MTEADGRRAELVDPAAAALIRRRYSPCADIRNQLASYLHAVVEEGLAARCTLQLTDFGDIRVDRDGSQANGDTPVETDDLAAVPGSSPHNGSESTVPVEYSEELFGQLGWTGGDRADGQTSNGRLLRDLAWCLAYQLNRSRLGVQTSERLGSALTLVGVSDAMHHLEEHVERAASVDLPTLIRGEFGTEKVQVACAVHFGGKRRGGPFVELRCASLRPGDEPALRDQLTCAQGGSIFLNGIDELHPELQVRLLRFLESRVGQWAGRGRLADPAVRLIASTTRELRELVAEGGFSEALFAELSFLPIEVPPLRRRRDDLRYLAQYALARHDDATGGLDADVLEAFEAYDWPQNLFEMERVLSRLVVMRRSHSIRLEDLEELAPRLVGDRTAGATRGPAIMRGEVESPPAAPHTPTGGDEGLPIEQLARRVLSGDLDNLDHWHPGILRALRCIGERYQDGMTLGELAGAAYVSPSHLCYLFRSTLGVTFKGLLGLVRIERAKQLLVEEVKRRITDISLDVGFGDLSHFEKTFKRIVKASPREYRRRRLREVREQSSLSASPRGGAR